MNINVIVPVWEGTGKRVIYCVNSLVKFLPAKNILVLNDVAHPIASTILEELPRAVRISQSTFDRRGNLNGADAVKGILDFLYAEVVYNGADFVCKIDPDVLVNNASQIIQAAKSGSSLFITKRTGKLFGGSFYMIRADILELIHTISRELRGKYFLPEDQVIGSLAYMYASEQNPIILGETGTIDDNFAPFVAVDVSKWNSPEYVSAIKKSAGIVNFGTANLVHTDKDDELLFARELFKTGMSMVDAR